MNIISTELRVRYADCDAQGIIFNGRWFELFDTAMTELLARDDRRLRPPPARLQRRDRGRRNRCAISRRRAFDDVITFAISVLRTGASSMRVEIDATRDGGLLAGDSSSTSSSTPSRCSLVEIPEQSAKHAPGPGRHRLNYNS